MTSSPLLKFARSLRSGALFLFVALLFGSCEKKGTDVSSSGMQTVEESQKTDTATAPVAKTVAVTEPVAVENSTEVEADAPTAPASPQAAGTGLRFLAYNVENWLLMEERYDFDTRVTEKNASKPEKEKAAVVEIVKSAQPDVLGVCEIGTKEDLADIQARLKAAGLDLPHSHFAGGMDHTRHLGLLSRHPISATAVPTDLNYRLNGKEYGMQRGILDATVKTPDGREWRFLGVHLKSKRDVEDGDQNLMRINEAQLLRKHIDGILTANPQARLIAYGDFNDTRRTSPLRIVQGPYNSPRGMSPIGAHDSREQYWTHFWAREDVYSRFDYIHFSQALKKDVNFQECGILDPKNWNDASDHRAVLGVFR